MRRFRITSVALLGLVLAGPGGERGNLPPYRDH